MVKIGIIGGSGLDDPKLLDNFEEKEINTPYGEPSSKVTCGKIKGVEVCIISRHGKNHSIPPSQVNFRANISSLKELDCTHIIATSAVGSLREEIRPGNLVFPSQFIDFTRQRKTSFFDNIGEVRHTPMAEPFSKELREILKKTSIELGFPFNSEKTVITIEGPRFSSKAESHMFRGFGADVINMSTCPEVILANELGIPYQVIAMSTDYDCWKENEESVSWEMILKIMHENSVKVKRLLVEAIKKIEGNDILTIKDKIRTVPNFPKQGIMFRDITTLIGDADGLSKTIDVLYNRYKDMNIEVVCGIESRGFIIGSILAHRLNLGFVPIRKKGKLPYTTIKEEYDLEYGKDEIHMHIDSIKPGQKVLLVDDLIATGGTMLAACNLVKKLGGDIFECAFVVDLPDLKGSERLRNKGYKVYSILEFEGE